jgi:hypothetical protein
MNNLGYLLYKLLNNKNYDKIKDIINENILDDLLLNNGCLSNLLLYFTIIDDRDKIDYILLKNNLMKRDYIHISKYFYDNDLNKSISIFRKINYNNLDTKDINYIIKNKLYKLLYELEGLFIYTTVSKNDNIIILPNIKLKINNNNYINKIENDSLSNINITSDNFNYEYIIDAGNILHRDKGIINEKNINGLNKILNNCNSNCNTNNILIIIHEKHFKNNIIRNIIKKYKYFLTPYNYNDDLFILWFFFKNNSYIITNDKFKDHNNNFNIEYNYNILKQYLIPYDNNYDLKYKEFNFIRRYENMICIPYENSYENNKYLYFN